MFRNLCGNKMSNNQINLMSEITCPHCHTKKMETMPTDACQRMLANGFMNAHIVMLY